MEMSVVPQSRGCSLFCIVPPTIEHHGSWMAVDWGQTVRTGHAMPCCLPESEGALDGCIILTEWRFCSTNRNNIYYGVYVPGAQLEFQKFDWIRIRLPLPCCCYPPTLVWIANSVFKFIVCDATPSSQSNGTTTDLHRSSALLCVS